MIYKDLKKVNQTLDHEAIVSFNAVRGGNVNIQSEGRHYVEFTNKEGLLYEDIVRGTGFVNCSLKYYIPYHVEVLDLVTKKVIYTHDLDLKQKRVVVELSSKALGDTLAWMPYVEEFRKKHDCYLTVVTYHNSMLASAYPYLSFSTPGSTLSDVYAWYHIGWFYDGEIPDRFYHPNDFKNQPLQKTASDVLGLEYKEIEPIIAFQAKERPIQEKYVAIANHSTLQAKYWNNPTGWQEVVDHLNSKGYLVLLVSKEKDGHNENFNPKGVIYPNDYSIDSIMNYMYHADFFIGLGSGLSWLSWALGKPTVLISGFSEPYTEMSSAIRVESPEGKCRGCFNRVKLQNDGSFNWCPDHFGTRRQFECTTSITGQMVIDRLPI